VPGCAGQKRSRRCLGDEGQEGGLKRRLRRRRRGGKKGRELGKGCWPGARSGDGLRPGLWFTALRIARLTRHSTHQRLKPMNPDYILTLSCPDRPGIVHSVSGFLLERGGNIIDADQFSDSETGLFFMRVHFAVARPEFDLARLRAEFGGFAGIFAMEWQIHDAQARPKVAILVSQHGHCLNDLLYRHHAGNLRIDIPAILSNHEDFRAMAGAYGIPFHHLPVSRDTKAGQEARILEIVQETGADLVVLARYMQILSEGLCRQLSGRAVNIHHSFLPSFKGARPYAQAHRRGVKLIGATAHFVTTDLDEGPIIEQDVARIDHSMDPDTLTAIGRDVECVVLARAVKWLSERRVMLNGGKTVVFR
jgi:formyltetrahydrofolate deformylase